MFMGRAPSQGPLPRPEVELRTPMRGLRAGWGVALLVGLFVSCAPARAASPEVLACAKRAAHDFGLPFAAVHLILDLEGGRAGQAVANTNGTHDLGPMQINTWWLPQLKAKFGLTRSDVRDKPCINVYVGAWILAQTTRESGSLVDGIARYHSPTTRHQHAYLRRAVGILEQRVGDGP